MFKGGTRNTVVALQSISDFIAADDPGRASRMIEEFFGAFDQLASWPRSAHLRPDLTNREVRFWPVRSYREVVSGIQMVAILHASRDVPSVLGDR